MSARARAQVASIDLIVGVVIAIILIGAVAVFAANLMKPKTKAEFGGKVFTAIETAGGGHDFLSGYNVSESKLASFALLSYSEQKNTVFAQSVEFSSSNDFCMFFLDSGSPVQIGGSNELGHSQCSYSDPCPKNMYGSRPAVARIYTMPVLRTPNQNRGKIVTFYVAVCG